MRYQDSFNTQALSVIGKETYRISFEYKNKIINFYTFSEQYAKAKVTMLRKDYPETQIIITKGKIIYEVSPTE